MPAPGDLPDSIAPFAHRQAAILSDRRWRAEVKELIDHLTGATPARTPPGAPLESGDRPAAGRSVTRTGLASWGGPRTLTGSSSS